MSILNSNSLIIDKWRIINPRLVDSSVPLYDIDLCDLRIQRDVVELLDMFIIVDEDEDEYLMMKSRSVFNGMIFKDISTIQERINQTKGCKNE